MDLLPGLQVRVVPPPVPRTTRLLTPPPPTRIRVFRSSRVTRTQIPGSAKARLLRRLTKQHPAEHRDLLRQLRDPRLRDSQTLLGLLGPPTPVRHLSGVIDHSPGDHAAQNTPTPPLPPRTTPSEPYSTATHPAATAINQPTGSPNTYITTNTDAAGRVSYAEPLITASGKAFRAAVEGRVNYILSVLD